MIGLADRPGGKASPEKNGSNRRKHIVKMAWTLGCWWFWKDFLAVFLLPQSIIDILMDWDWTWISIGSFGASNSMFISPNAAQTRSVNMNIPSEAWNMGVSESWTCWGTGFVSGKLNQPRQLAAFPSDDLSGHCHSLGITWGDHAWSRHR